MSFFFSHRKLKETSRGKRLFEWMSHLPVTSFTLAHYQSRYQCVTAEWKQIQFVAYIKLSFPHKHMHTIQERWRVKERERESKIWGCEPWERRQRGGNGMQRINSVKLHTLTPGSLHHTHTLVQTLSTHSISATNLSHVHPSSFILSFGFLRLNFLYLLHFLSTSPSLCARNGTLPYCPNFCSMCFMVCTFCMRGMPW